MPTDLLSQIEAAAAMGEKATERPWFSGVDVPARARPSDATTDHVYSERAGVVAKMVGNVAFSYQDERYIVAAANLPLAAIAEELRTARTARESAERERDIQIQGNCRLSNDLEALTADRDRLAAECESLRAVVERLPKTADGVVLVPELDSVFHPGFDSEGDIERSGEVEWVGLFYATDSDGTGTVWTYPISDCYSTRAAAEAARLAGKPAATARLEEMQDKEKA